MFVADEGLGFGVRRERRDIRAELGGSCRGLAVRTQGIARFRCL
jgi:hypothetical protein